MINFRIIFKLLGSLLLLEGLFMSITIPVSLYHGENMVPELLFSSLITFISGVLLWLLNRKANINFSKREGYIIVTLGWVLFSFFGCIPFLLTHSIPSFTDAFFETISGFTTTGASVLNDIESLPHAILLWRSMTQWLGGMGIIVMTLAILPILGIGGMQLFIAEVPGISPDKLHPRVKETAKRLWIIYIIYTFAETLLLKIGGMSWFDAVCHAFTTMATGGYSTYQASIAHFNSPFIEYVIIVFMFLAGTNFTLSYAAMHFRFRKIWQNEEFRFYISFVVLFTIAISLGLTYMQQEVFSEAFRKSLFQVVSIITTTGYVTADYLSWVPVLTSMIFLLMFFGGSAGSTGGGIKIARIVLLFKNSYLELKRQIHPNAIIPVRLNNKAVSNPILSNVLAFVVFYLLITGISMIIMASLGLDLESSLGAVAATLGNIGPGIGSVGPAENFHHIPDFGKWFLSFLMLLGRLELFTVLILFTGAFWKK